MKEFFKKRGRSLTQVALAWVLKQPVITSAIVGASKPQHLDESLPAVDLTLDQEELKFLDSNWFNLPRINRPEFALR